MIAVIDSGGANITSILFALQRLQKEAVLTRDLDQINNAEHVILPGVGVAHDAMQKLQDYQLLSVVPRLKQPVLGICLGMQLLYQHSKEGEVDCLNILEGEIHHMQTDNKTSIPHMGWNQLEWVKESIQPIKNSLG